MRPTDYLQSQCPSDWQYATSHIFCQQLGNGTLPLEKLKYYLIQDYMFVDGFVRLLASAIAHAPSLADSKPAAQFLAVITGPENTYFLNAFKQLNISENEWKVKPAPATLAFQNLMASAAHSRKYEEMLAVLTVAEWSYLSWATPFYPPKSNLAFHFSEWINLHAGHEFEMVVEYLRNQLDQIWNQLDETAQNNVNAKFQQAVKLECQFFDQAFNAK